MTHRNKPFEIVLGKGENAGSQCFLFFSSDSTLLENGSKFSATFILSSINSFKLDLFNPFPNDKF